MITGDQIASDIAQYEGQVPYAYGGDTPAGWDCSGCVSWVLFHDLRMRKPIIAGVTIDRPVVMTFVDWAATQPVGVHEIQPGDLCIWPGEGPLGHIGIAVSNTEMISALNPTDGTIKTPIEGYGPKTSRLSPRRITSVKTTGARSCPTSAAKAPVTIAMLIITRLSVAGGNSSLRGTVRDTRSR